jgi:large subunit ribosomal protein L21
VYAVISDRNRQNGVRVGDVVECDLNTTWTTGDVVKFDNVLFLSNEGEVKVGTPHVAGASVSAEVLGNTKGKKEVIFRFKRRKNVRIKKGHRQKYTRVRITSIDG